MVNQLKQTKTARTDELKLCNKREESGKIIIKIGHRGFVSVLADLSKHRQIWISHLATPGLYVESNVAVPQTADFAPYSSV